MRKPFNVSPFHGTKQKERERETEATLLLFNQFLSLISNAHPRNQLHHEKLLIQTFFSCDFSFLSLSVELSQCQFIEWYLTCRIKGTYSFYYLKKNRVSFTYYFIVFMLFVKRIS